jgi:acylphosphatase
VSTVEILIAGRVQKVGFRACVKKIAINLGICGEVMNLPDGRVRIYATADQVLSDKFISMLYGCPRVVIRELEVSPCNDREYRDFSINRMGY